jgi:hypothetical protein
LLGERERDRVAPCVAVLRGPALDLLDEPLLVAAYLLGRAMAGVVVAHQWTRVSRNAATAAHIRIVTATET